MPPLIYSLLYDLQQRCKYLLAELQARSSTLSPDAKDYEVWLRGEIEQSLVEIEFVLSDPDLTHPSLAKQYHLAYKGMAQRLSILEENAFQAIRHFDEDCEYLTRVVDRLCKEGHFPYPSPLCSTLSTSYYWAISWAKLIFTPPSEAAHLLALPDLFHELGHFIIDRARTELVVPLLHEINQYYVKFRAESKLKGWPSHSLDQVEDASDQWLAKWYEEFAADIIATLWVGPAFGWTNIRVCANISGSLFRGSADHPADNARAYVIEKTLEELGFVAEALELRKAWSEFVTTSGQSAGGEYDIFYPTALLDIVVKTTVASCSALGLMPYSAAAPSDKWSTIAQLLNFAWAEFCRAPADFAAAEQLLIQQLKSSLSP
jgi:hypothetical protein